MVVLLVAVSLLTGCDKPPEGGYSTNVHYTGVSVPNCPGSSLPCPLNNSAGSPQPSLFGDWPGSCMYIHSDVSGRRVLCRAVDGYEPLGYPQNWDIQIQYGYPLYAHNTNGYGYSIALSPYQDPGGAERTFEGCRRISNWDGQPQFISTSYLTHYVCNYRVRNQVVADHMTGGAWSKVLSTLWYEAHSDAATADCAFAVMGWTAGVPLALKALTTSVCAEQVAP